MHLTIIRNNGLLLLRTIRNKGADVIAILENISLQTHLNTRSQNVSLSSRQWLA